MDEFFGKGKEKIRGVEWDWENFNSTEGFPVSDKLLDWVIGQDKALEECYLCLEEWIKKVKKLQEEEWWKDWESPDNPKPLAKKRMAPGPFLLLVGDPGTGKSLIGRALAEKLTELYKEHGIKLYDVMCWRNKLIPSEPKISLHPTPKAREILRIEKLKEFKRNLVKKSFFKILQAILIMAGVILLTVGFYFFFTMISDWINNVILDIWGMEIPIQEYYNYNFLDYFLKNAGAIIPYTFLPGGSCLFFGVFIGWLQKLLGNSNLKGIGGAEASETPKIIVDNSDGNAKFVDATGHGSAQLFGSIAWDPYQTGGLGTPEHQRVTAGDVHRANLGILFIDEIKNLRPDEAITLLTALEDGQLPITIRSMWHGADTSAMAVSTEPVPCVFFLVGAGNFDSLPQIHPALMDRIAGYGKVVMMNNDMPNTVENRRKYLQFIAQEIKRFNLLPFSREACIEVINEARRRSNKRDALTTKFRPLISIIKTASVLASLEGKNIVERKHVLEAIEEHCKSIQRQILEHNIKEEEKFLEIKPHGKAKGIVYGLAVSTDSSSGEEVGCVLRVKAQLVKATGKKKAGFKITGIPKDPKYIKDSAEKVRAVILKKFKVDIDEEYTTHLDFSQEYSVDGPSAGVTMAIAIASLLLDKPVRQDTAITGEINISPDGEIEITAVGGVYEKIKAAERWGFKQVIIPEKNYLYSIDPKDFKIKVLYGKTLDDYLKIMLS